MSLARSRSVLSLGSNQRLSVALAGARSSNEGVGGEDVLTPFHRRKRLVLEGDSRFATGDTAGAIREWIEAHNTGGGDDDLLVKLGDAHAKLGQVSEAVERYQEAADRLKADGFFLKAASVLNKILRIDPTMLSVHSWLAELYESQGLFTEARQQWQVLGDSLASRGKSAEAIAPYLRAARVDPGDITVLIGLAHFLTLHGRTQEAARCSSELARLLISNGLAAEAVEVWQSALAIHTRNFELADTLADARRRLRSATVAPVFGIEEKASSSDDRLRSHRERAAAALVRGDVDGAFSILEPEAQAAGRAGDLLQSIRILAPILDRDPGHLPALKASLALYRRALEETFFSAMDRKRSARSEDGVAAAFEANHPQAVRPGAIDPTAEPADSAINGRVTRSTRFG